MSDYITETYTLKYYGECCNYRRQRSRVEIWWKGTLDSTYPRRIADITGLSLAINGNEDIDAPVVKTILTLSMADTWDEPQEAGADLPKHGAWDEFYTPDSTAYLVRLFTREDGDEAWTPRWSGYITPDNWRESISYRGSVSVTARDNLGHLKDFAFDLAPDADGMVSAWDVITGALAKIAFPMDVILGVAADGERATLLEADAAEGSGGVWDALFLASMFKDSSWEDVFTAVLDSLGLTVRFVDNNTFAITFIRNLPLCGRTAAPEPQDIEFYGAGTRMLVPAYREVKIGMDFDYERDVPFPSGVTGQYGTDESFRWSYYDDRLQKTVSGNAMRTDVAAPAIGWGSSGKAFVNTGTYRIVSRQSSRVTVIDPDTTALIIANASQADVKAAMAIYNFGTVNTPAGKVRLNLAGSLKLAGLYLINAGVVESLEWAASYQTDSGLLWWNGSQWKSGGQTWARTENGEMDFSAPMNLQDVPSGGALCVFIRDVVASAGFCVAVAGVTLSSVDPAARLKSDTVTVVNNPDYNVRAERHPDFAPLSRSVAWNVPENYPNALWRRRGGDSLSPFPYQVIWSDGEENLPLPVQWAKQTLMFHHSALQLIEGDVGVPDKGMWRFDRPAVYKGHQFIPQGGTLDLQTGHLSGARLREYIDYTTLWAGGVTVTPASASFPAAGGQVSFALHCAADKDWAVTGLPDWLEADVTSGRGSGTVTLTAARNDGGSRSETVYIGGVAVRVSQEKEEIVLSISPASAEVSVEGGNLDFTVQASPSAGWRVVSSDRTWLYVNGRPQWMGEGYTDALIVSVQANKTGAPRTAELRLYDEDVNLVQTVPITQTVEAAELTLTISTNVESPSIALTLDGSAVPYSAGMVIPAGAAVGVTVSKTGYTTVTDSFTMSAEHSSKYYELTQDITATISYPNEITAAAQSVRFTISDPSGHGWRLDWTNEDYFGYITGGAVVSGNATRNGKIIDGTGDAVVTLSVAANTNDRGRWVGRNPASIYFRDKATSSLNEVSFYQNAGSATIVPVTSVTLNKSSLALATGGSERLTATVSPTNATNPALSWTSTNTSVATVDQDGTVRAVGAGTCVIRATATDGSGKYGSCSVTVTSPSVPVTGVSLNESSLALTVGEFSQLYATVYPANADNKAVSWSSSDSNVASVSSDGLVTAVNGGQATITVTTADGGYTASCVVTVNTTPSSVPVTGVSLDESSLALTVGESAQLTATVYPANADNKAVSWSSSDSNVASVSSSGLVTAVNGGQATITVTTADGGYTASCVVTVKTIIHTLSVYDARLETSPTVDFSFSLTNTSQGKTLKGVTVRLRDASKSYDDTLLSYESEKLVGLLTAQGGTFTYTGKITASDEILQSGVGMRLWVRFRYSGDGIQYTGYSDVAIPSVPVTGVSLDESSLALTVGESAQLTATVYPANADNKAVSWSSSDSNVASVSSSGLVTAVNGGQATITVTTADGGYTASCVVTVNTTPPSVPVTSVTLNKSSLALATGGSERLTATVSPTNATNPALSWTSTNTSVATVDQDGTVRAVGAGTCVIRATATDGSGKYGSCSVTVTSPSVPVTGVSLNESSLALTVGESAQLTATVYPANADNKAVSWSSSEPTVASVSSDGLVTAVNGGQATITVTTADGGYTASCVVTVNTIIHTISVYDARLETSPTVDFSFMLTNTTLGNTLKGVTVRLRDASKSYDDTLLSYESEKFVGLLTAKGGTFTYTGTITASDEILQSGVGMRLWVRFRYSGDGTQYTGYSDVAIPQD